MSWKDRLLMKLSNDAEKGMKMNILYSVLLMSLLAIVTARYPVKQHVRSYFMVRPSENYTYGYQFLI